MMFPAPSDFLLRLCEAGLFIEGLPVATVLMNEVDGPVFFFAGDLLSRMPKS